MKKETHQAVIVFGSTGHLGQAIVDVLRRQNIPVCAVVRNAAKAALMRGRADEVRVADVTDPATLRGVCQDYPSVVSALGKSVSPFDFSKPSFEDVDLNANTNVFEEAVRSGVKKFVYVSAFGAERLTHLTYFRVHHQFSERLKQSGLDYSIVKPPALFSAFLDLVDMAKKGRLATLGDGEKRTNPIAEDDLAQVCVQAMWQPFAEIEAGGKEVLSRRQINAIIQHCTAPNKKVRTIPLGLIKASLPLVKLFSRNTYDKSAFFLEVLQHDLLAPKVGEAKLEDYLKAKAAIAAP